MSMVSYSFILFIALLIPVYFLVPKAGQWIVLLSASLAFYLTCGWRAIFYLAVTIVSQWALALILQRKNDRMQEEISRRDLRGNELATFKKKAGRYKKGVVALSVLINIGLLCYVKYMNFIIDNINIVLKGSDLAQLSPINVLVPLGISFYTFKSVGYVVDVYRGRQPAQRNLLRFALYISYFPALTQGPIDQYQDLAPQLNAPHSFDRRRAAFGIQRMIFGYMKKLIIADRAFIIVNQVLRNYEENNYYGFYILFAIVLYAFAIYADFSGGIDIALGLSEVFGIYLTENFRQPYLSCSIAEFWQRWHITLGAWMRDYLFYPLSLSSAFNDLRRKCRKVFGNRMGRVIPTCLASFVVFFLVGVWHGASWNYIVFGLYHAVLVSSEALFADQYKTLRNHFHIKDDSLAWKRLCIFRTFILVSIGRYFARSTSLADALGLFKATFHMFNPWILFDGSLYQLGLDPLNFWLLVLAVIGLIYIDLMHEKGVHFRETIEKQPLVLRWGILYLALFSVLVFGIYGPGYDASAFIYQKF